MLASDLKEAYLCQLGFVRLSLYWSWDYPMGALEASFIPATDVRYLHQSAASDGARLYAYSWVQEPGYLLSTERHLSAPDHIVAELETDDPIGLRLQVEEFFRQHGGRAPLSWPATDKPASYWN
ncbi:hypothetical protein MUN84_12140 [Hymenobacter sp. 5516J-16]|uniref:Uncharacterized protein n=1 Tax=Hymenobacter sublimis TaxID=2933777 RepID=A0ABY4J9N6_9BACT|nr:MULTISPECIES: hypothetical protein [Hymenobacter]UOQ75461.1 hypothetical protein MUN84_12140 [Hymenobacter sp. 5516J-16]UPL49141.1 hypothetical protein MWH26_18375 [Hymenobacter sublimis]